MTDQCVYSKKYDFDSEGNDVNSQAIATVKLIVFILRMVIYTVKSVLSIVKLVNY